MEYRISTCFNHGWVDNDGDGINDLEDEWGKQSVETIKFGEWFKLTTYIYRDLEHGIVKLWINGKLQYEISNVRTMGIDPSRLADTSPNIEAWLSSGFALYSGGLPIEPQHVYFDDFILANRDLSR